MAAMWAGWPESGRPQGRMAWLKEVCWGPLSVHATMPRRARVTRLGPHLLVVVFLFLPHRVEWKQQDLEQCAVTPAGGRERSTWTPNRKSTFMQTGCQAADTEGLHIAIQTLLQQKSPSSYHGNGCIKWYISPIREYHEMFSLHSKIQKGAHSPQTLPPLHYKVWSTQPSHLFWAHTKFKCTGKK